MDSRLSLTFGQAAGLTSIVLSAATVLALSGPPAHGDPITVAIKGFVSDGRNFPTGVKVKGRLSNGPGLDFVSDATAQTWTTKNGNYSSPPAMTGNTSPAATLNWTVWSKTLTDFDLGTARLPNPFNLDIRTNTYTYSSGDTGGTVTLAAGKGTVNDGGFFVSTNKVTTTYDASGAVKTVGSADPTYSFTPSGTHQGTITFSDTFNPSIPTALFEGLAAYSDGTTATDNNSLETIFDQSVQISPISVLGENADGTFNFGTSTIQIGDSSSGIYLAGNIVDIYGFDGAGGPVFGGVLELTQLGGSGLNSKLIDDFASDKAQGAIFQLGFDPTFLTATNDFDTSASQAGAVDIVASVPEPGSLALLGFGLVALTALGRVRPDGSAPRRRAPLR